MQCSAGARARARTHARTVRRIYEYCYCSTSTVLTEYGQVQSTVYLYARMYRSYTEYGRSFMIHHLSRVIF